MCVRLRESISRSRETRPVSTMRGATSRGGAAESSRKPECKNECQYEDLAPAENAFALLSAVTPERLRQLSKTQLMQVCAALIIPELEMAC